MAYELIFTNADAEPTSWYVGTDYPHKHASPMKCSRFDRVMLRELCAAIIEWSEIEDSQ